MINCNYSCYNIIISSINGIFCICCFKLKILSFAGFLIDIVGRLPLLIASTVFMSLALAGFGSYAYYMSQTQNLGYVDSAMVGQHDWIPLLCVLVFTTALALGISPISWLLIGELFPLEYRGLGSSISTSFSYFCAFFGIKLFMDFQQVSIFSTSFFST